jgi:preprotein translocase subunit SecA
VPIEHKMVTRAIASAQTQIEQQNFEIRKNVLKYDEVLNRQRLVVYAERRKVLDGADLEDQVRLMMDDTVTAYVDAATSEGYSEEWDLDKLWTALKTLYPVSLTVEEIEDAAGGRDKLNRDILVEELQADVRSRYDDRETELGDQIARELERRVVLSVLDRKWREHLYEMDYLQEGIGLRAMAQRDPLVEYQREGYDMFQAMMEAIKEESVGYLFHLKVEVEPVEPAPGITLQSAATTAVGAPVIPAPGGGGVQDAVPAGFQGELRAKGLETPRRPTHLDYSAPAIDGAGGVEKHRESYADYRGAGASGSQSEEDGGYTSAGDDAPRTRGKGGKRKKR